MLSRLSESDRHRFEAEIIPQLDVLYRMASSVCNDPDLAADIAQESFLKAVNGFGTLRPGTNARSWLVRIVHNTCRDHWRSRSRQDRFVWDEAGPAGNGTTADVVWEPDIIREAFTDDVELALRSLPPHWRAAVMLVDVEGWSYEDAAESLSVAVGTLRSALHRARRRLYGHLCEARSTREGGASGKGGLGK